jgi:hypothetical protein
MFWRRPKSLYVVLMHLNGRHPYLESTDLDYPSRDIEVPVHATGWSDAEKQAFRECPRGGYWSCHVRAIRRAGAPYPVSQT